MAKVNILKHFNQEISKIWKLDRLLKDKVHAKTALCKTKILLHLSSNQYIFCKTGLYYAYKSRPFTASLVMKVNDWLDYV